MEGVEVIAASASSGRAGIIVWTNSMTKTMLGFLAGLVADGKRTSSGFKDAHHRQCVAVLNEQLKLSDTEDQVKNHLKKWSKI